MSFFSWILVGFASILIVVVGYAGVTGKSIFTYKTQHKKKKSDR